MSFAALVAAGIVVAAAVTAYVLLPDEAVAPAAPDELTDLEELEAA
jgi:hypothetical protein